IAAAGLHAARAPPGVDRTATARAEHAGPIGALALGDALRTADHAPLRHVTRRDPRFTHARRAHDGPAVHAARPVRVRVAREVPHAIAIAHDVAPHRHRKHGGGRAEDVGHRDARAERDEHAAAPDVT